MSINVKELKKKRASYKSKLTQFKKYYDSISTCSILSSSHSSELNLRLEKIEEMYNEYDSIQLSIETQTDISDEGEYQEREEFEQQYFKTVASARDLLHRNSTAGPVDIKSSVTGSATNGGGLSLKLPIIHLPTFSGQRQDWLEFHDTYNSLIHTNDNIPKINKFHYLRSALKDTAKQVIGLLDFSASNYDIAWQTLCERYHNDRLLISNHIQSLLDIESIPKESSTALRSLIDAINKNLRALNILNIKTDNWDVLIIHMASSKLDVTSSRAWKEHINFSKELPTLEKFITFLKGQAELLESVEHTSTRRRHSEPLNTRTKTFITNTQSTSIKCNYCQQPHLIYQCLRFKSLPLHVKLQKVKQLKLCSNCLRQGHEINQCKFGPCKICNKMHNTMLHTDEPKDSQSASTLINKENERTLVASHEDTSNEDACLNEVTYSHNQEGSIEHLDIESAFEEHVDQDIVLSSTITHSHVLLSTALIDVLDNNGGKHTVRALLDNGSTTNFITEELSEILKLPIRSASARVEGLNCKPIYLHKRASLKLSSRTEVFSQEINCLIVPQITQLLPTTQIDISTISIPSHINLADPGFNVPSKISVLLNAEVFWGILGNNRISLGKNMPILSETKLGWLVSGNVPTQNNKNMESNNHTVHCHFLNDFKVQGQLDRFFELESVPSPRKTTKEEEECEKFFVRTTSRQPDGRFVVKIPLKQTPEVLGDSYNQAATRFSALERRFNRDPLFKEKYCQFMQEYIDLGHMSINKSYNDKYTYIMPHHGILKESNLTTKLRSVFDASAATSTGLSYNDIQHVGPSVQDDLISILIRFRQHRYVVTSDCEKMYRCVLVSEEQRSLQQILWRFDPTQELNLYKLNTVSYGTASAMWLATRCLVQLAQEDLAPPSSSSPSSCAVRETILHDFYVDDYISGHDSEKELLSICQGVINQLRKGQFHLRKWRSNSSTVLEGIKDDRQDDLLKLVDDDNAKTLGLRWSCKSDSLFFSVNLNAIEANSDINKNVSKRSVLSTIGQIFDPLGLINPCILQAKLIMQDLWASKLSWDERLPSEKEDKWLAFLKSLPMLNEIIIPRCVLCKSPKLIEIHSFSDASLQAYSACIYLRSTSCDDKPAVHLVMAKSKVAPLKGMTVPRLELSGALLAVRMATVVKKALRLTVHNCYFWCDSMVVLGWIRAPKASLKSFVLNRINEITESSDAKQWSYVPTNLNPADIGSRGSNATQLKSSALWWFGPQFLAQSKSHWPKAPNDISPHLPELKIVCKVTTDQIDFMRRFSNYSKLQRVVATMLRFIHNCRNPKNKFSEYLKVSELSAADVVLCRKVQIDSFPKEHNSLECKGHLPHKSQLLNLNPFLSKDNIIRVGGRLCNSNYDYDTKHPMLLHSSHYITLLLFRHYHKLLMHAGPQLLLSVMRHKYWTIGGRNIARKVTHECITCCRFSGKSNQPIMSSLPKERLHAEYPFSNVAVDYAGPIMLADRKGRGCKLIKAYICVFVCLAVKAVHAELVTELSTEAFIAALNRFIARRGKPVSIYSDNGTNFVGAHNEFSNFLKSKCNDISAYASEKLILFKFSPAYSPHFNGLAEGSVKSIKHHLKRTLSLTHLTYEEMNTLLIQIEGILNSRPLTPLSSDPNDLVPLTPSHFLLGRTLNMLPSPQVHLKDEAHICTLPRYKRIRVLTNHFWNRYYKEYISELQKRVKWQRQDKRQLQVGDMVVLKDDRLPPNRWLLGRILRLYPGSSDGCPRVADILTSSGVLNRAYNRICLLPAASFTEPEIPSTTDVVEQNVPPRGAC